MNGEGETYKLDPAQPYRGSAPFTARSPCPATVGELEMRLLEIHLLDNLLKTTFSLYTIRIGISSKIYIR